MLYAAKQINILQKKPLFKSHNSIKRKELRFTNQNHEHRGKDSGTTTLSSLTIEKKPYCLDFKIGCLLVVPRQAANM